MLVGVGGGGGGVALVCNCVCVLSSHFFACVLFSSFSISSVFIQMNDYNGI